MELPSQPKPTTHVPLLESATQTKNRIRGPLSDLKHNPDEGMRASNPNTPLLHHVQQTPRWTSSLLLAACNSGSCDSLRRPLVEVPFEL